jgi:hypothetical protein
VETHHFAQPTIRRPGFPEIEMHKQVVEYAGVPVGVLVPRGDSLTFLAVKFHVMGLDGRRFSSLADARNAIHAHVARGGVLAA